MPLQGIYRPILDTIALGRLTRDPDIPEAKLGVDQPLEFQPYNLSYIDLKWNNFKETVVLPDPTQTPIEYTGTRFNGNPVKPEDFPMNFYVGNPIGGV